MSQTLRFAVVPLVAATLLSVVTASAAEQATSLPKQGRFEEASVKVLAEVGRLREQGEGDNRR